MPMLQGPPPPSLGAGSGQPPSSPSSSPNQPSYGGTQSTLSQPSGGEQMSDPKTILASVFDKLQDLIEAVNQSFPGGEDKVAQGLQEIGMGFSEKIQQMGSTEPPGPPIPA